MKIVFMGTPEFAIPSLDMLVKEGYEVAAVVTQPDKPKGRGNKLTPPPIMEYAVRAGIEVLQPVRIKRPEFVSVLKEINPDLFITVAYGQLLSQEILDIPKLGCINVHGSLLPKYRGAAPIHWALINGEAKSGITTMFTDIGMDTGDMLLKSEVSINEDMTVGELHEKLALVGAEVLRETLKQLEKGTLERIPQPSNEATNAPILQKDIGKIDWTKSPKEIHNLVRGTNPWPGAFTFYKKERVRVWKLKVVEGFPGESKPGVILEVDKEGIKVACGTGLIIIEDIQFEGSKRMSFAEYIRGHKVDEGEVLG